MTGYAATGVADYSTAAQFLACKGDRVMRPDVGSPTAYSGGGVARKILSGSIGASVSRVFDWSVTGATGLVLFATALTGVREPDLVSADWAVLNRGAQLNQLSEFDVDRQALVDEIRSYLELLPGWDGENGVVPSQSAVDSAVSFISILPLTTTLPKAMLESNGEVGFYWNGPDHYGEVAFSDNGCISFYVEISGTEGEKSVGDVCSFDRTVLPEGLSQMLTLL